MTGRGDGQYVSASETASCVTESTGARPLVSLCGEQRNLGAAGGEQKRRDVEDAWHLEVIPDRELEVHAGRPEC
jgi:hypothetical protein